MRQETTLEKQKRGRPITDAAPVIWLRDRLYPLFIRLSGGVKVKYQLQPLNGYTPLPDKPIIFAANHSAFPDGPTALRATGRRSYLLIGKQNLDFADWLFFAIIGAIWVDRQSKADMVASKGGIAAQLAKGQSGVWFPEGTWNLTDCQLIMPMKWGIIEVAREAGAQIIPLALDYDRETQVCRAKFGEPMAGAALENKAEGIRTLRDTLATLRWDLLCQRPTLRRAEITPEQLRVEEYRAVEEYPPLDWVYEQRCIYRPYEEVETVPEGLEPCRENAFLFDKRLR